MYWAFSRYPYWPHSEPSTLQKVVESTVLKNLWPPPSKQMLSLVLSHSGRMCLINTTRRGADTVRPWHYRGASRREKHNGAGTVRLTRSFLCLLPLSLLHVPTGWKWRAACHEEEKDSKKLLICRPLEGEGYALCHRGLQQNQGCGGHWVSSRTKEVG